MKKFDTSIIIQRPIEEVFATATEFDRLPAWRSGLIDATIISPGFIQTGAIYRFDLIAMGKTIETTDQIEAYEPPTFYGWKVTSGPFPMSGSIQCEAIAEGTRITNTLEADPGGFFKLAEPLLMRQQRSQMEKDLKQLKALLEEGNS